MKGKSKKLVTYLLIAVVGIFCYFGEVNAQNSKRFDLDTKTKTYALEKNQEVVVIVNNVGKYDVVSVEGQSTNSRVIEVKGWEVSYGSNNASLQPVGASEIEAINSINEQSISFDGKTLLVNNQTEVNKRRALHILLPAGARAKLYVNGELMQSGTISMSSPAMLQGNRAINSSGGYSPNAAILQAMSRGIGEEEKSLPEVDSQTLRRLANKVVSPRKFEDKGQRWAIVQLTINEEGKVASTFYAGGDKRLAGVAEEALKEFSFRPYIVNDKPTIAGSVVGVSSTDGEVKLFTELDKLQK